MPQTLRYLLVADGSSDACLIHPIEWLLSELGQRSVEGRWADLRELPDVGPGLARRLRLALEVYPADLVFIHRDSESSAADVFAKRIEEIETAVAAIGLEMPYVCIVPVRMTEAWLLHDEAAIRRAAGRPNGRAKLPLPPVKRLEQLPDPKSVLRDALLMASGTSGGRRRRKRDEFGRMRRRVAEQTTDYAPLRVLEAFSRFEHDLQRVIERMESTPQPAQR